MLISATKYPPTPFAIQAAILLIIFQEFSLLVGWFMGYILE
jgi:hypothetical protein